MLMPRNRPRRGSSRKKSGGGVLAAVLVVGLVVLLAGGGVAALLILRPGGEQKTTDNNNNQGGGDPKGSTGGAGPVLKPLSEKEIKIQKAIDNGVKYLRKQILEGDKVYYNPDAAIGPDMPQPGSDVGVQALAALTLLECGVGWEDAAVQKVHNYVFKTENRLRFTYSLALTIMFLDRLHQARKDQLDPLKKAAKKDQELIDKLEKLQKADVDVIYRVTVRILAAQHKKGGWGYNCPVLPPQEAEQLLDVFKKGEPFEPRVEPNRPSEREDSSINQFVTLALWMARRHDIKTDAALLRVAQRYRTIQVKDGGWGYTEADSSLKDATTCAGLITLAVDHAVKADADKGKDKDKGKKLADNIKKDKNIQDGMNFLGQAVGRTKNISQDLRDQRHRDTEEMLKLIKDLQAATDPDEQRDVATRLNKLQEPVEKLRGTYFAADAWGDLYFLWSVERVAVVFDLQKIGTKDWYAWGSELILKFQKPNGSWEDRFPGLPDTCFALLFLKRANVVKDLTNKLRGISPTIGAGPNRSPTPAPPRDRKKD
jgi:hypothetical protein